MRSLLLIVRLFICRLYLSTSPLLIIKIVLISGYRKIVLGIDEVFIMIIGRCNALLCWVFICLLVILVTKYQILVCVPFYYSKQTY